VNTPRILVVDDDDFVLRSTERSLKRNGFEPVATIWPADALRMAQEQPFAAVVSDMMMPVMHGLELRRAIIEKVPGLDGKFVFVTGGGYTKEMEEELKQFPHLQKPYGVPDLIAAVRKITG
jgi:DNA-binding NtrC family response regulator